MANEYGIVSTIDSSGATVGAREFKRAATDLVASAGKVIKSVDAIRGAFRDLNSRISVSATGLRNTLKQLGTDSAKSGTAISSGFLKSARSMTNSAERIERQAVRTSTALRTFASSAIQSNNQMATSLQRIPSVQAKVTSSVIQSNSRTTGSFNAMGAAITALRPLMLGLFAGFGMSAVIGQIATFDQSIAQIRALMGPAALQKDIDAVTAKARELGATTVFSGTDAAAAMAELVRAGFNTQQAMTAAGAALDLAAADTLDMATAAGITANILASFGMAANEATHASDVLAYAANASQTDVRGVGEAMKYAGSMAKTVGVSLEDAAAAVGTLSNAGLEASMAGTGLRSVLAGIVGPTKQAREAMAALGLNAGKVSSTLREKDGLIKAITMFSDAQKKLGNDTAFAEKALAIFGQRGGPALLALTNNIDNLKQLATGMQSVDGVARQMAETMTDSLVGAYKELESAAEELILQLGDAGLKKLLREGAEGLGAFGRGLAGMSEEVDKASKRMVSLNATGTFLRENFEAIKDTAILLASVYATRLLVSITASTAAMVKNAWAAAAVAAQSRVTTTTFVGMTTVMARATTGQIAATAASNGLRVAMAALGGPVGLIITLATTAAAAVLLFGDNADEARRSADELSGSLDSLAGKWDKASAAGRRALAVQTKQLQMESEQARDALVRQVKDAEAAQAELKRMGTSAGTVSGGTMSGAGMSSNNDLKRQKLADQLLSEDEKTLLLGRISELDSAATDAKVQYAQMSTGVFSVGEAAAAAAPAVQTLATEVAETAETTKDAAREFNQFKNAAEQLMKSANPLAAAQKEYNEGLATLERLSSMSAAKLKELGYTHDQVKVAVAGLNTEWEKQNKELDPLYKKHEDLRKAMDSAAKAARPAAVAQDEYNLRMAEAKALLDGTDEAMKKAGVTREQVTQGIADMTKELELNNAKVDKSAKQADSWETMWKRAIERIDDAFVSLWESALDGGNDFGDQLKKTFKSLFAEIMHANVTKPLTQWMSELVKGGGTTSGNGIMNTVSSWFGGGGAGGSGGGFWSSIGGMFKGGSATGGGGNGLSGFTSLFGGGASSGGNTLVSNFTGALKGFTGLFGGASSGAASGTLMGFGNVANMAGTAGANAGALSGGAAAGGSSAAAAVPIIGWIIAGMMKNAELFDQGWTMDQGESWAGKIATAGAVGLADKGFRALGLNDKTASILSGSSIHAKLFGRKAPEITSTGFDGSLDMAGFTGSQFANIKSKGGMFRSDKKWTQTSNLDGGVQDFLNQSTVSVRNLIKDIGEVAGSETAATLNNLKVTLGTLTLDKDADKAKAQIEEYATSLQEALATSALKALNFASVAADKNSTASQVERLQVAQAMVTLINTDSTKEATKAYEDSLKSSMQLYREQSVELTDLLGKYDGTVDSLTQLTESTAALKNTQQSLMLAFKQLGDYGKTLFGGTQKSIRESLMTDDQLYTTRQGEIQTLMEKMRTETDPTKLKDMADQINSLTNEAYGMLDEEQKKAMAGGFLSFLDEAQALLEARATEGFDAVSGEAGGLNDTVSQRLNQAAQQQMDAANVFVQAVNTFAASVGSGGMSGGGSGSNGNVRYSEF